MKLDEGLALASYTRGLDPDGWVESSAIIGIVIYSDIKQIQLHFWIPEYFEPREISCLYSSKNYSAQMLPGVICEVNLPCEGAMTASEILINVSNTTMAEPPDLRALGAVLLNIKSF